MRVLAAGLLLLGLAQMAADLAGLPKLRGLAAATTASPAPRVFSAVDGLETYSTRFALEWRDPDGGAHALWLTPEVYARLRGPYNRRNAYGALLAYGPVLARRDATRPMFEHVARYALCGEAPVLAELGIDPARIAGAPRVRLVPRAGSDPGDPIVLEAPCR